MERRTIHHLIKGSYSEFQLTELIFLKKLFKLFFFGTRKKSTRNVFCIWNTSLRGYFSRTLTGHSTTNTPSIIELSPRRHRWKNNSTLSGQTTYIYRTAYSYIKTGREVWFRRFISRKMCVHIHKQNTTNIYTFNRSSGFSVDGWW